MIKMNKKAIGNPLELILILFFVVFFIVALVLSVMVSKAFGSPKDLSETASAEFNQAESTAILNGLLRTSIVHEEKTMTFAEFIRTYNLEDETIKKKTDSFLYFRTLTKPVIINPAKYIVVMSMEITKSEEYYKYGGPGSVEYLYSTTEEGYKNSIREVKSAIPGYKGAISISFKYTGIAQKTQETADLEAVQKTQEAIEEAEEMGMGPQTTQDLNRMIQGEMQQ